MKHQHTVKTQPMTKPLERNEKAPATTTTTTSANVVARNTVVVVVVSKTMSTRSTNQKLPVVQQFKWISLLRIFYLKKVLPLVALYNYPIVIPPTHSYTTTFFVSNNVVGRNNNNNNCFLRRNHQYSNWQQQQHQRPRTASRLPLQATQMTTGKNNSNNHLSTLIAGAIVDERFDTTLFPGPIRGIGITTIDTTQYKHCFPTGRTCITRFQFST
jgi:hypothetical protein